MKKETQEQIELLEKYGVTNYTVDGDQITINGHLDLSNLESIPDSNFLRDTIINGDLWLSSLQYIPDSNFLQRTIINGYLILCSLKAIPNSNFLQGTTINGNLYLNNIESIPNSNFLQGTTINGHLDLDSLESIPDSNFLQGTTIGGYLDLGSLKAIPDSNFLQGTIINGHLNLRSLTSIPDSNFLQGTIINGYLFLDRLKSIPDSNFLQGTTINVHLGLSSLSDKDIAICRANVKQLQSGYNPEKSYCYFDGILSKVLSVKETNGYTIYTTPFEFIAQKDNFTAHAKTIKQAILDVEFKIVREKIQNDPIKADDLFTVEKYRMITGACDLGCRNFMQKNNIPFEVVDGNTVEKEPMTAKDLMKLLEETRPYGYDKIKSLVTF